MSDRFNKLGDLTIRDFLHMILPETIGDGISRQVYTLRTDETKVVKFEVGSYFQNINEYELWNDIKEATVISKWFAPVHFISGFGSVLIMERTEVIPLKYYPKELPAFLSDLKKENFGFYKGRIVCHDYGFVKSTAHRRLKKVSWSS
jgi:hypothetical protein